MLTDWHHWLTSLTPTELVTILGILLFVDGSRYAVCTASMALFAQRKCRCQKNV